MRSGRPKKSISNFQCHVLKKKHLAHFTLAVDILKYHPGAEGTNYIQHFTTLDLIGQI